MLLLPSNPSLWASWWGAASNLSWGRQVPGWESCLQTALCSKPLQQAEVMALDLLLTPLILGCSVIFLCHLVFWQPQIGTQKNGQKRDGCDWGYSLRGTASWVQVFFPAVPKERLQLRSHLLMLCRRSLLVAICSWHSLHVGVFFCLISLSLTACMASGQCLGICFRVFFSAAISQWSKHLLESTENRSLVHETYQAWE